jgi:hypothetical protein
MSVCSHLHCRDGNVSFGPPPVTSAGAVPQPAHPIGAGLDVSVQKAIVNNSALKAEIGETSREAVFCPLCGLQRGLTVESGDEARGGVGTASHLKRNRAAPCPLGVVTRRAGCRYPRFEGLENVSKRLPLGYLYIWTRLISSRVPRVCRWSSTAVGFLLCNTGVMSLSRSDAITELELTLITHGLNFGDEVSIFRRSVGGMKSFARRDRDTNEFLINSAASLPVPLHCTEQHGRRPR